MNEEKLFEVAKLAWRKHNCGDDSVGWEELENALNDAMFDYLSMEDYEKLQNEYMNI